MLTKELDQDLDVIHRGKRLRDHLPRDQDPVVHETETETTLVSRPQYPCLRGLLKIFLCSANTRWY